MSNQTGTLEIIQAGQALDISDRVNYLWEEADGFGMPTLHRITERGPLQHGESDRGYRLDPRVIQIAVGLRATGAAEYYDLRGRLLEFLSPASDAPISLRYTNPLGAVRQIDGYCTSGPLFPSKEFRSFAYSRAAFQVTCPDPAWYDPERQSVRAVGASGGTGFNFPLAVPWTFGGTSVGAAVAVPYDGSWRDYPEIQIVGPVSDAKIEHLQTGDVLDFDGITIANGDSYTIDLRYGRKTVVSAAGVNKIADLTPESDLATWHLRPGANTVQFSGVSAGANTSIILRFYNRYLGV